jgi:hypothetical protein
MCHPVWRSKYERPSGPKYEISREIGVMTVDDTTDMEGGAPMEVEKGHVTTRWGASLLDDQTMLTIQRAA